MKNILVLLWVACFSITLYAQTEFPRYTLIEAFSSSTCGPCYNGNITLKNVLAQNDAVGGKYTLIKYQMNWPGNGDPYYTAEGNTRRNAYGVSAVPWVNMDGSKKTVSHSVLLDAQAVPSYVKIDGVYKVDGKVVTATIQVNSSIDISGGNNLRLYVAIIEKTTYNNWKTNPNQSNGEKEFYHVMKKFMSSSAGTILGELFADEAVSHDYSWEFKGDYRLPNNALLPINHSIEHSVENFENLEVVAWVQNASTKQIYNSGTAVKDDTYAVNFQVINENGGTLTATVDGIPIDSGTILTPGTVVDFVAENIGNYYIKEWKLNGVVIPDYTSSTYSIVLEHSSANLSVHFTREHSVCFDVSTGNGILIATLHGEPITSGDMIEETCIIEFKASPNEGYIVKEWKLNNEIVADNATNTFSLTVSADATVTVEFEELVGINENSLSAVELYPNPVNNELTITHADYLQQVIITNTLGKIVFETLLTGKNTVVIPTKNLLPGIFFVTVKNYEGTEITKKIIKI